MKHVRWTQNTTNESSKLWLFSFRIFRYKIFKIKFFHILIITNSPHAQHSSGTDIYVGSYENLLYVQVILILRVTLWVTRIREKIFSFVFYEYSERKVQVRIIASGKAIREKIYFLFEKSLCDIIYFKYKIKYT